MVPFRGPLDGWLTSSLTQASTDTRPSYNLDRRFVTELWLAWLSVAVLAAPYSATATLFLGCEVAYLKAALLVAVVGSQLATTMVGANIVESPRLTTRSSSVLRVEIIRIGITPCF